MLNIKPTLRPIELIKKRLSDLEKIKIDSGAEIKFFYSELTFALRSFFEKEVYDKALESTTIELILKLNNHIDEVIKDEEKVKLQDHGKNLAGQVTQEFILDNKFAESS